MADIGAMLREARMRGRIDISEIEAETKIRAKYLRALENEEWDLLPGPTFVKSFLRTYAEALHLDAKLIVEEYKLRHERPTEFDLQPIRPTAPGRERRGRRGPLVPRWAVGVALATALLAALYALGSGGGHSTSVPTNRAAPPAISTAAPPPTAAATPPRPRSDRVSLQIVPIAPVYVCLIAGTRKLVNQRILLPGTKQPTFHAKRFVMTLGNGQVKLRVGGKLLKVPQVNNGIGYVLTATGRRVLPVGKRPTCA
jgi:hypothetical protein